jgi:polar amino acid transport system ATP-binding protein
MTALQQIIEGPLSGLKRPRREIVAQAMAALERVGLAGRRDAYPGELSEGERRRVAIACALAVRPRLMLFDAPTAALAPEQAVEVLAVMRDLAAGGMTMIVVTDDPDFVRAVASAAVFMDKGEIAGPAPGLAMRAGLP